MSSRSRSFSPQERLRTVSRTSRSLTGGSPSPPRSPADRRSRSPRSRSRSSARSRSPLQRSRSRDRGEGRANSKTDREQPEPNNCLGVFGLSYATTEADLEHKFSKFGRLDKVNLVLDGPTKKSRGFGFVYFRDVADATKARDAMDGKELQGFKLRVDYSITREAHKPTPGVYFHHGKALKPGDHRVRGGRPYRDDNRRPPYSSGRSYRDERPPPRDYYRPRERESYPDYPRDYFERPYYREDKYYDLPPRRDDRYREDRYYEDRYRDYERSRYYEHERRYERTPPLPEYSRYDRYAPLSTSRGQGGPRRSPSPGPSRSRY